MFGVIRKAFVVALLVKKGWVMVDRSKYSKGSDTITVDGCGNIRWVH